MATTTSPAPSTGSSPPNPTTLTWPPSSTRRPPPRAIACARSGPEPPAAQSTRCQPRHRCGPAGRRLIAWSLCLSVPLASGGAGAFVGGPAGHLQGGDGGGEGVTAGDPDPQGAAAALQLVVDGQVLHVDPGRAEGVEDGGEAARPVRDVDHHLAKAAGGGAALVGEPQPGRPGRGQLLPEADPVPLGDELAEHLEPAGQHVERGHDA